MRWWRIALLVFLVADIGAAWILLYPPGGSATELEQQLAALQAQTAAKHALLTSTQRRRTVPEPILPGPPHRIFDAAL